MCMTFKRTCRLFYLWLSIGGSCLALVPRSLPPPLDAVVVVNSDDGNAVIVLPGGFAPSLESPAPLLKVGGLPPSS